MTADEPDDDPTRRGTRGLVHDLVTTLGVELRTRAIRPGEKLPSEAALMTRFGVGRGVVREALSRLQAGGLVQTHAGVGTFALEPADGSGVRIATLGNDGIEATLELLELRTGVECDAAALAAVRRTEADLVAMRRALDDFTRHGASAGGTVEPDQRFHAAIGGATGNRHFGDVIAQLGRAVIPRTRVASARLDGARRARHLSKVNLEHEDIYLAIERRDAEAARAAMRLHLVNSRERQRAAQLEPPR